MKELSLFQSTVGSLISQAEFIADEIKGMPIADQVETLNVIKRILHDAGPFKDEPVDCVEWVSSNDVIPNDYNPNAVAPPEMRLLEHSIRHDGYTQPIVVAKDGDSFVVVDGFHRTRVGKECTAVRDRVRGYLPVVRIRNEEMKDRMAATIRHNRARGVHGVSPMINLVAELVRRGWTDLEISKELGMSADEVLRYKQHAGLPELFKGRQYSKAWEPLQKGEENNDDDL